MTELHKALSAIMAHLRKLKELDIAHPGYSALLADLQLEFFIIASELRELASQNEELQQKVNVLLSGNTPASQ